jgi:hypothetical protein
VICDIHVLCVCISRKQICGAFITPSRFLRKLQLNMFDSLPDDLCQHVLLFLPASDIMTSLQLNKSWSHLGSSWTVWRDLLRRDSLESTSGQHRTNRSRWGCFGCQARISCSWPCLDVINGQVVSAAIQSNPKLTCQRRASHVCHG